MAWIQRCRSSNPTTSRSFNPLSILYHSLLTTTTTKHSNSIVTWSVLLVVTSCWFATTAYSWVEQNRPNQLTKSLTNSIQRKSFFKKASSTMFPHDQQQQRVECSNSHPLAATDHDGDDERKVNLNDPHVWYSPDGTRYLRMEVPPRADESSHVIFGHLLRKPDLLKRYEVYRREPSTTHITKSEATTRDGTSVDDTPLVVAFIHFGKNLDGHPGIVHGGILALMLDDIMGFGFGALGIPMAFTANLNINYRQSVMANDSVRVDVYITSQEGRKLHWKAQMKSLDDKVLYNEATSLYIIPKTAV